MDLRADLDHKLRLRFEPALRRIGEAKGEDSPASDLESLVKGRAAEIWPCLEQVRDERGESGPLTEEQFHIASIRQSRSSIRDTLSKMQKAIGIRGNPRLDSILAGLVEDGVADLEAMTPFEDPNLTEAAFDKITALVIERAKARVKRVQG